MIRLFLDFFSPLSLSLPRLHLNQFKLALVVCVLGTPTWEYIVEHIVVAF